MAIDLRTRQIGQYFSTGVEDAPPIPIRSPDKTSALVPGFGSWLRRIAEALAVVTIPASPPQFLPVLARRRRPLG